MKKILTLAAAMLLLLFPFASRAEEMHTQMQTQADNRTLTYEALEINAQELLDAVGGYTLQNDPAGTYDPSGEGAYLYDYGALQLTLTGTELLPANVRQIEILDASAAGPGGVRVGDDLSTLLAAFDNHNPHLTGDESFAVLYADEIYAQDLPAYEWAWVLRKEQTVYGVQYACSLPQADGTYIDAGALFILTDGAVSAIRLYGFGEVITAQAAAMNFDTAREMMMRDSFTPENTRLSDAHAGKQAAQSDLTVNGKALLQISQSALIAAVGEAQQVRTEEDEAGNTRQVLTFEGMEAVVHADAVEEIAITDAAKIGPCGLRVGMDVRTALAALRVDAPVEKGKNATLYLEGEAGDDPPYAYMDFFEGERAAIRIGVRLEGETARFAMIYADVHADEIEEIRMVIYEL